MNSSSTERISNPGPNLVVALTLSRVAGSLNRAMGGGLGGIDWPGPAAAPIAEGATTSAGVPPSTAPGGANGDPPAPVEPGVSPATRPGISPATDPAEAGPAGDVVAADTACICVES